MLGIGPYETVLETSDGPLVLLGSRADSNFSSGGSLPGTPLRTVSMLFWQEYEPLYSFTSIFPTFGRLLSKAASDRTDPNLPLLTRV